MKHKLKGFTMIELIVVMAIIAVLAGVLMPNMITAIRKAKVNTVNVNAKAIFNSAQTIAQQFEFNRDADIQDIFNGKEIVISSAGTYTDDSPEGEFRDRFDRYYSDDEDMAWRIYLDDFIVKTVIAAESETDFYVGRYPNPMNLDDILDTKKPLSSYTDAELQTNATTYYSAPIETT